MCLIGTALSSQSLLIALDNSISICTQETSVFAPPVEAVEGILQAQLAIFVQVASLPMVPGAVPVAFQLFTLLCRWVPDLVSRTVLYNYTQAITLDFSHQYFTMLNNGLLEKYSLWP